MSAEALIEEGRRLQRKCVFLKSDGDGEAAAVWHHPFPRVPSDAGFAPWLTVDTRSIPGCIAVGLDGSRPQADPARSRLSSRLEFPLSREPS